MLKIRLNLRNVAAIAACLAATMLTSCGGGSGVGSEMKLTVQGNDKVMVALDGYGTAAIDWGDGSTKKSYELSGKEESYEWQYSQSSSRTIKIVGENITTLAFFPQAEQIQLTNLDVSKNTALKALVCIGNFTSLDVSKNTALETLVCVGNLTNLDLSKNTQLTTLRVSNTQLNAAALNALFGTLHSNTIQGQTKHIILDGNLGQDSCDRSIAENKGWIFGWR